MKAILLSSLFDATADFLYNFFIDSKLHTDVTGSKAIINNKIGGKFTAWDGYIKGEIVSLKKNRKIIQKWRTTEFTKEDKDSILEITIEELNKNRSKLTLKHSELPEGTEEEYKNGWKEYYMKPLKEFIKKKINQASYAENEK
jgi:activator of HSP90 ATPase